LNKKLTNCKNNFDNFYNSHCFVLENQQQTKYLMMRNADKSDFYS